MAEKQATHSVASPQVLSPEQIRKIDELAYAAFEPCSLFFQLLEDAQLSKTEPKADWWYVGEIGNILFDHGQKKFSADLEKLLGGGGHYA